MRRKINLKQVVSSRGDVSQFLAEPCDAVLVERGRPRWLVMACPCGCGEEVPINLDTRAGPAWRFYRSTKGGCTLFPSVWRDTGCQSHYILWHDHVLLFGADGDDWTSDERDADFVALCKSVASRLNKLEYLPFAGIADAINEIPWDVLAACRHLTRKGLAVEGDGKLKGAFRLRR